MIFEKAKAETGMPIVTEIMDISHLDLFDRFVCNRFSERNIELFSRHGVMSETEIHSRVEILYENYAKLINIEARTMVDMVMHQILPAALRYSSTVISP